MIKILISSIVIVTLSFLSLGIYAQQESAKKNIYYQQCEEIVIEQQDSIEILNNVIIELESNVLSKGKKLILYILNSMLAIGVFQLLTKLTKK